MSSQPTAWRVADVVLVLAGVGGAIALVAPARIETIETATIPAMPEVLIVESATGDKLASIDADEWRAAHEAAQLPAPGVIRDVDPAPVEVLTTALGRWLDVRDAAALGAMGEVYLALELHSEAIQFFAAAASLQPENPLWMYLLGAELQSTGEVEAAEAALERVRALEPGYALTHARLGELYLERGDWRLADEAFEAYVAQEPDVSLGYVGSARVALAQQQHARARNLLERAVQTTPNDFLAWRHLSRAYAAEGELERAEDAARRAEVLPEYRGWLTFDARLAEAHARARTQRAIENEVRKHMAAGATANAIAALEELVRRRPRDAAAITMLAQQHLALSETERAKAYSERVLELEPAAASSHALQAMVHLTLDEFERAHMAIDAALQCENAYAPAWELRGRVHLLQNQPREAAVALAQSVELSESASARYMLAIALAQDGRTDEAATQLERVLELAPGHAAAQQMLESLRR